MEPVKTVAADARFTDDRQVAGPGGVANDVPPPTFPEPESANSRAFWIVVPRRNAPRAAFVLATTWKRQHQWAKLRMKHQPLPSR